MMTAQALYETLLAAYGQPQWWSDNPYTVMVQAVLVQNTAWSSVLKVTAAMEEPLTPQRVLEMETDALEQLIRPCGFCKAKAATLRRLTAWYAQYDCDAQSIMHMAQARIRRELLSLKGIGAETADVILVYGFHKPSFIIDVYTRRFLARLGYGFADDEAIRQFFQRELPMEARLYGWFHWLILMHGIQRCKKNPACGGCPFYGACHEAQK
ncbi:MAG: endonuclease [Eubacteriales bacterium]|nr:endonuclease [Eubacteriales bacterium]